MGESFWPARNVAEYIYCPRLFYYMQVEGIQLPSQDTEKGLAVHRRVDQPSTGPAAGAAEEEDPGRPAVLRSLVLSSRHLQLTATLDLTEIDGKYAVPIEYRKGRPKRFFAKPPQTEEEEDDFNGAAQAPQPWPIDRVQVGLQALLLEEAGYTVVKAVLYYSSEKLKLTIPVDDALKAEALEALQQAKDCAAGERPLPLVNDPRCPRCSLQPLCLPDEINYQRTPKPGDELTPRKIWPPRDDGIHVVAQQEGVKIGIRGMELRVTDRTGAVVRTIPLANIESLSLLGPVQLTTQALHALANMNIPIAYLSAAGRLLAIIDPLDSVSAAIRRAQVRQFDCAEKCLELTRALITAKIANQRTLLLRNHKGLPENVADELAKEAKSAAAAASIESIRGHEGQAAALYFKHFSGMFKGKVAEEFDNNGRQRRPPPDPINACLSFAYTMLTHECTAALRTARLEPAIGGFHVSKPGRPAFALDLMEPFRPLIADSIAVTCFNKGELTEGHFMRTVSGCAFTDAGRRSFFNALGRRMDTEITHPLFEYRLSYRRMIILHARMIAAWLAEEIPSLAFLTTR